MTSSIHILTHRGLNPDRQHYWPESSQEAFADQLQRGFGLEFDPTPARDGFAVSHDATLARLAGDARTIDSCSLAELASISYGVRGGHVPHLRELLKHIAAASAPFHALHLKRRLQMPQHLDALLAELHLVPAAIPKLIVFDCTVASAEYLQARLPALQLAPSVAHSYDIERYGAVVGNTLLSVETASAHRSLFSWVWLDEWDTLAPDGAHKVFYTPELFATLRAQGFRIALVTPELHASSPGLYGGESHADAASRERLFARIKEIVALGPDAVCTDHPDAVASLVGRDAE